MTVADGQTILAQPGNIPVQVYAEDGEVKLVFELTQINPDLNTTWVTMSPVFATRLGQALIDMAKQCRS